MSIRTKLTLIFLAIALIPIILVELLTFNGYEQSIESSQIQHLQDVLSLKADKLTGYFDDFKDGIKLTQDSYSIKKNMPILSGLADEPNNPEYISAKKIIDEQLQRVKAVLPYLTDIMLISPQGKIVYAIRPAHYSTFENNVVQQKAIIEGKREVYFSDIYFDKAFDRRYEMYITAPVKKFDNTEAGEIVFELDMKGAYDLIHETTALGKTGESFIGKKTGNEVLFLSPTKFDANSALNRKVKIGDSNAIPMQKAVQEMTGGGVSTDYRGEKVIGAWTYLPSLKWGFVAKIDASEAFADVAKMRELTIAIICGMFVMGWVVAFYISLYISQPIEKLSAGTRIIGSGNLDYKVANKHKDEIGELSRAFDKMTSDLKNTTASRDELNKEIVLREEEEEELKRVSEELARSNQELEHFAHIISHDLREPLRAVSGFVELLKMRYKDKLDEKANEYIEFAFNGTAIMRNMILGLLEYSRVQSQGNTFSSVDTNQVVNTAITNLSTSIADNKAEISVDKLPTVDGDESQLIRLFQNLIHNSIKFKNKEVPKIHIGCQRQDGHLLFTVKDNGIGISEYFKEKIFTIFQREHKNDRPGDGVGLAVCKRIVERHNGKIWVESEQGKGTTFYFTISD